MTRAATVVLVALVTTASAGAQAQRVTLRALPTSLGPTQNVFLSGRVSSGGTGEAVTVQLKYCGQLSYRAVAAVRTAPGGVWQVERSVGMNATVRARWRNAVSRAVLVRQAPLVQLDQTSAREFEVGVGSLGLMWRKRVQIHQRVDGSWRLVRTVRLTETYAGPGSSGVWTDASFTLEVPVGTVLRAVLTAAEARPCYLGAASSVIRTQG